MPNASEVRVGAPDQLVSGAIKRAPLGTTLPAVSDITVASVTLDQAFTGDEYISSDGLTFTPEISTVDIGEWGGAIVRKPIESANYTFSWTMISTNENALGIAFGTANVSKTAATSSDGTKLAVQLGARQPERQSWAFLMKDGDARIVIIVPDGQVTEVGEVTFAATEAVGWNVTMTAYPDSSGNCAYIYTDDGVKAVGGTTTTA